ncbi:MAG: hypothetical protein ACRD2W_05150 [Acidimicrobiales bacterium]
MIDWLTANGDHSLALTADGSVWAWGGNGRGQFGNGSTQNSSVRVRITTLSGMRSIAAGRTHSLACSTRRLSGSSTRAPSRPAPPGRR